MDTLGGNGCTLDFIPAIDDAAGTAVFVGRGAS